MIGTVRGGRAGLWKRYSPAAVTAATAVLAALGSASLMTVASLPAEAAPQVPGTPVAPAVLFTEDFENRPANSNLVLDEYTGANGTSYTGHPYWVNRDACNGFIINQQSPQPAGDCTGVNGIVYSPAQTAGFYNRLTALPNALGANAGAGSPVSNAAVSAYTNGPGPDNAVEFETRVPLPLPVSNRFVTFGVDSAAMNCHQEQPELMFFLRDAAGVEHPVSNSPLNVCSDPKATAGLYPTQNGAEVSVRVGSLVSDSSMLLSGGSFGIVMRNQNGRNIGNDAAFDNIRVFDVTPQLDKAFSDASLSVNGVTTLTFTVTNTSELAAKNGWAFTDALPAGLTVTATPNIGGTCNATTTAPAGSSTVTTSNGVLAAGQASCTITVDVTSGTPSPSEPVSRSYTNGPDNFTSLIGLNPPADATVEFHSAPALTVQKTASPSTVSQAGDMVNYSFLVTNTGTSNLSNITVNDTSFTGTGTLSAVTCPATTLVPGASTSCTATYQATQADIDAGSITNTATAQGTPPGSTVPVVSSPSTATVSAASMPALSLVKTAALATGTDGGESIRYSFAVTNTGNVTITDVTVKEQEFTGTGALPAITCPDRVLSPGETTTCSTSYTLTRDDLDSGIIANTAAAAGNAASGPAPDSPPSTAVITTTPRVVPAGARVETGGQPVGNQPATAVLGWALLAGAALTAYAPLPTAPKPRAQRK